MGKTLHRFAKFPFQNRKKVQANVVYDYFFGLKFKIAFNDCLVATSSSVFFFSASGSVVKVSSSSPSKALMTAEERQTGGVSWDIYFYYLFVQWIYSLSLNAMRVVCFLFRYALGSYTIPIIILVSVVLSNASKSIGDWWLVCSILGLLFWFLSFYPIPSYILFHPFSFFFLLLTSLPFTYISSFKIIFFPQTL